jgi:hypothetical protein
MNACFDMFLTCFRISMALGDLGDWWLSRKPRGPSVVVLGSLCQALVARGRGGQRAMLSKDTQGMATDTLVPLGADESASNESHHSSNL